MHFIKHLLNHNHHFTPKDPGSAITHFIGMLMAVFAGIPLNSNIRFKNAI